MVGEDADMERFWDERAREDAFYFVDNRLVYGRPDVDRFWSEGELALDEILDMVGVDVAPHDTVLDIGCGVGRLSRVLAGRASQVYALDISSEMLTRAKELNPDAHNIEWVHGDGTTLAGVPDGAVQGIVSHVVFQHIPDPAIVLGYVLEMGRVLAPGGWSVFQVSNDPAIHAPQPKGRLERVLRRGPKGQDHAAWLGSSIDLGDLEDAATTAGMAVEQVHGAGTQFCMVLVRRALR
jgi:SAM-dependent methyltransferase